jgi:hypothetical protein
MGSRAASRSKKQSTTNLPTCSWLEAAASVDEQKKRKEKTEPELKQAKAKKREGKKTKLLACGFSLH